jgi:hypothetical protein
MREVALDTFGLDRCYADHWQVFLPDIDLDVTAGEEELDWWQEGGCYEEREMTMDGRFEGLTDCNPLLGLHHLAKSQ